MCRKLFLLTFLVLALGLVSTNTAFGGLVHVQVAAGTDDASGDDAATDAEAEEK